MVQGMMPPEPANRAGTLRVLYYEHPDPGPGGSRRSLLNLILGLGDNVSPYIAGNLPPEVSKDLPAQAVVAQEAGQKGAVIRRWNAGLFTTGGPQDIADKIMLLERDRALCRQLGLNGRRAVLEYYNWSRAAAETEAILMETLGQRERG
jgi:glycosyltransferase involved in cell wall biosynthesis